MVDIADLIDRNEFMRLIQEAYQAAAEKAGTYCKDIVHVVRCKDCKWYNPKGDDPFWCDNGDGIWNASSESYCSLGERREDNGDS